MKLRFFSCLSAVSQQSLSSFSAVSQQSLSSLSAVSQHSLSCLCSHSASSFKSLYTEHTSSNQRSTKYFVLLRLNYVRNASGLIRDKARLLHYVILLFIGTWVSKRVISHPLMEIWKGLNFSELPKGKLCMLLDFNGGNKDGVRDEAFFQRSNKFKVSVILSQAIYTIFTTYFFLASLIAR